MFAEEEKWLAEAFGIEHPLTVKAVQDSAIMMSSLRDAEKRFSEIHNMMRVMKNAPTVQSGLPTPRTRQSPR